MLALCDSGRLELLSSEALEYETAQNPLPVRREHALAVLEKTSSVIEVSDAIEVRAHDFVSLGVQPLDALHLALAEFGKADYFCTCDDRLLARAPQLRDLKDTVGELPVVGATLTVAR